MVAVVGAFAQYPGWCGFRAMLVGLLICVTVSSTNAWAEDPRVAYWLHCAGCHGLEGRGAPPEVPTLVDEPGRIEAVPGGREYLIRVPGVAQAALTDPELTKVMNFMMEEFSSATLSTDFEPYSVDEIRRFRAMTLEDPLRRRAEIWPGGQQ